ncbi:MFS transporter [Rothia kristinae]|uniref:MFS transporter n=1 Tax=Rothia kristinae TaxID=37923 RepID=UPI0022E4B566|nr:MFS transporter [Rothia kristinae]
MSTTTAPERAQPPQGSTSPAPARRNSPGRVIFSSLIGTTVEYYDFYIYATAAVLVFPQLFFPHQSGITGLLASFAVFGVAFIARPLGSVIFGHLGDRLGRKNTLVLALLLMGGGTFLIGCLPTALTPGWEIAAPTILVLLRFAQGTALAGEWSGAVLLATENAPAGKRALYGSVPQQGAPAGFILANGLFLILTSQMAPTAFETWGWRVPFWASAVLVLVGLWTRMKLFESESFTRVQESGKVAKVPAVEVLRRSWKTVVIGTIAAVSNYVTFYFLTTFTLTYGTTAATEDAARAAAEKTGKAFDAASFVPGLGFSRSEFLLLMIGAVLLLVVGNVVGAVLAERWGRRKAMIGFHVVVAAFGLAVPWLLRGSDGEVFFALALGFFVFGLIFGPLGALLSELFPANTRYTGSALSYNIASILGAAVAPFIFIWLWGITGDIRLVGLYVAGAAVLSIIALLFVQEHTSTQDLAERIHD